MKEVLDGLARIHQVLHSLAMDVHELVEHSERQRPAAGLGETQSSESKLLSIKELAEYLGISSSTAYGLRHGDPGWCQSRSASGSTSVVRTLIGGWIGCSELRLQLRRGTPDGRSSSIRSGRVFPRHRSLRSATTAMARG